MWADVTLSIAGPVLGKGEAIPNFTSEPNSTKCFLEHSSVACAGVQQRLLRHTPCVQQPQTHLKHSTVHKCPFSYSDQISHL